MLSANYSEPKPCRLLAASGDTHHKQLCGVAVQMVSLHVRHNPRVQLTNLVVLAGLSLVLPVTLARDNVAGGLEWSLGSGRRESGCARSGIGRLVAVWELMMSSPNRALKQSTHISRLLGDISIHSH